MCPDTSLVVVFLTCEDLNLAGRVCRTEYHQQFQISRTEELITDLKIVLHLMGKPVSQELQRRFTTAGTYQQIFIVTHTSDSLQKNGYAICA